MQGSRELRVIGPAFWAIIVDAMGFGLVYPLMTELFAGDVGTHLGVGLSLPLRHFYLGLSFLLFPLAALIGNAVVGDLAESIGRKKALIFSMSGLTLSFLLMGFGVEFFKISLIFLGRALSGFMAGSQPIAQEAIVENSTEQTKERNLNWLAVVLSSGFVLGPLIGGLFSDYKLVPIFRLSTPFYVAAALAFFVTIRIAILFPVSKKEKPENKKLDWLRSFRLLYEGFASKEIRLLLFIFLSMQIGFSLFYQLIQVFVAVRLDFPSWKIGLFNGHIGLAFALAVLVGIKIFIRFFTIEGLAAFSLFLTGIFLIVPMLYPSEPLLWAMVFLAALFDMIAYGSLMALFTQAVNKPSQGWVMGVFSAVAGATWVVTGFSTNLIGVIGLRWLIGFGGLFMLLSFLLMMYEIQRRARRRI